MNQELIQSLSVITEEEQKILAGSADIDRTLYMDCLLYTSRCV